MPSLLSNARAVVNAAVLPVWTMLSVSAGVIAGTVTGDRDLFWRWQRHWARGLCALCGVELDVAGQEQMRPGAEYIIVANHASYMDVAALFAALPRPPQFIAKRELSRIPFLGTALERGRHVLIDRANASSARDSLGQVAAHVRDGAVVLVFPEGTRAVSDELGRFKTGAFRLAKLSGAAILPVGISGTRRVLPKHGRLLRPSRVRIRVGTPVSAADVAELDLKTLMQRVRGQISELAGLPLVGGATATSAPPPVPVQLAAD